MRKRRRTYEMEKNSSTQVRLFQRLGRTAIWVVAAALALTTAGCDLAKVGYRNGDTVGMVLMNRYLDLTGEQKDFIKPKLRALLIWHRTTQLPDYASFAIEMQKKASQPLTAADIATLSEQSKRRLFTTLDHALPDMADIVLHLTPANIRNLKKKFVENDDDFRKDYLSGDVEKRQKVRYEKTLERTEEWYGRFSRDQRAAIRRLSDARPLDNEILFAERQRHEQEIVALLTKVEKDKPSRDAVVAMMKAYADAFEHSPDDERRAFVESLHRATDEMNAQIHNLATPAQRGRASSKLQEWIDDFRSLNAEAMAAS